MKISIRNRHVDLTPSQREQIVRRVHFALGRWGIDVTRVDVLLADVNGPRGGADKLCRVRVRGRGGVDVVIEDLGADLVATAGDALDRAARTTTRAFERRRTVDPRLGAALRRRLGLRTLAGAR